MRARRGFTWPSGARSSRKAPRRRPPLPRRWLSRRRLARSPRRLARARRGVFWTVTSATSPWAICHASMGYVRRFHGHVRRIHGPQAAGSMGHVRRLHGPRATAPWATGGWQAAVHVHHDTVVSRRRRRRATAASSDLFCVPFGGGRQRERLYTSDSLFDDGGPCASTQTAPTSLTAARSAARACVRAAAAAPDGDLHQGLHCNALVRL